MIKKQKQKLRSTVLNDKRAVHNVVLYTFTKNATTCHVAARRNNIIE